MSVQREELCRAMRGPELLSAQMYVERQELELLSQTMPSKTEMICKT
jgi:hypothetical protein